MKKIIAFMALILLISCATTKKSVEQTSITKDSTSICESLEVKTERLIDTTKLETGKITITEIEFYQPSEVSDSGTRLMPGSNVADITINGIGKIKNAKVKNIRQTTIESSKKQNGESHDTKKENSVKQIATVSKSKNHLISNIAPAPDPYRWRYIFYIIVSFIIVVTLLYFKRVPIINWIKKILSAIRLIF